MAVSPSARADAAAALPTVDAVKAALPQWPHSIALPFTYEGLIYDGAKADACEKSFGAKGVVKDSSKLKAFLDCLGASNASFAAGAKATVAAYDAKKIDGAMIGTLSAIRDEGHISKRYPDK